MAVRILGIIGSPRKHGSTDLLVDKVLAGVTSVLSEARTDILYLNDLKILPCQACGNCKKTGRCAQNDDMKQVYAKINRADGIVLGAPIYIGYVSAQAKLLIDRMYAYLGKNHQSVLPPGKHMVLIITQGGPDIKFYLPVIKPLEGFFRHLGIKVIHTLIGAPHYEPGDQYIDLMDRSREDLLKLAYAAGQKLARNLS